MSSDLQRPPTHCHDHLNRMGITPWWPRYQLVGAKPSDYHWHPVDQKQVPVSETTGQALQGLSSVKNTLPAQDNLVQTTPNTPSPVPEKAIQTTQKVAPFTLQILFIPHQCWIINDLPYHKAGQPSDAIHQQLLVNIIRALGLTPGNWQEWRFNWPIAPTLEQTRHTVSDTDAVQSFVKTQWAQSQDTICHLFMGKQSCHYFPKPDHEQLTMPLKGHTLLSLDECLAIPGAKRQVWQDIKWLMNPIKRANIS